MKMLSINIVLTLFCLSSISAQSNIIRGPYLQKASPTSMTIKWRTEQASTSKVFYGEDIHAMGTFVIDSALVSEHEISITRLKPNTNYHYSIEGGYSNNVDLNHELTFKTLPLQSQKLRAWVLGDCGMGDQNTRNVRDAFLKQFSDAPLDMMLFLGDNAYHTGTDLEYQRALFTNMYEEQMKKTVSWSCLGNHDGYSANSSSQTGPYYDIFSFPTQGECGGLASGTESYYSFDHGNAHFIVLNSYDENRSTEAPMFQWCLKDIKETDADWIIAVWHHPPYSKGSHNSDLERELVEMRENFLPMLEANGLDLVLSGHSHSYERSYFLHGHYENSNTFDATKHTLGKTGSGSGQTENSGAYSKKFMKSKKKCPGLGSVYITAGSSSKISGGTLNHPAMFVSLNRLGSILLEIDGAELKCSFIQDDGTIGDHFSIMDSHIKPSN